MRNRGFTLIELMVSLAVVSFCISLVMGIFVAQQKAFQALDLSRLAAEAGRDASLDLETSLRRAGWGVDPRYAFDFQWYQCPNNTPLCRDQVGSADEVVFVARNPNYQWTDYQVAGCANLGGCFVGNGWNVVSASPNLVINARGGEVFHKGRVLLVACADGASPTMVTVGSSTTAAAGNFTIPLMAAQVVNGVTNPYRENNLGQACLSQSGASVFLVDRFRYYVASPGYTLPGVSGNPVPFLMLDTGLDYNLDDVTPDAGDTRDLIPVAKGVEDLQIGYVINNGVPYGFLAPDNGADWILGDTAGLREEPTVESALSPIYTTPSSDPSRFTVDQTNIHGLRFEMTVRSANADTSLAPGALGDPMILSENRNVLTTTGQFRRVQVAASVACRNMESRSTFIF